MLVIRFYRLADLLDGILDDGDRATVQVTIHVIYLIFYRTPPYTGASTTTPTTAKAPSTPAPTGTAGKMIV